MKNILILILILCLKKAWTQQEIIPISQDGVWIMGSGSFQLGVWTLDAPWRIGITDTVNINDTLYLQFSYLGVCTDNTTLNEDFLLREDSGKYYHKDNIAAQEELWFDFTGEVGDSIWLSNVINSQIEFTPLIVSAIEVVTLGDGSQRRMWTLQYVDFEETEQWIEGIGSTEWGWKGYGPGNTADINLWLRCYYENELWVDSFTFIDPGTNCCSIVGVQELEQARLNLYPNPTTDQLNVECPSSISALELVDITGRRIIVSKPMSSRATLNLDLLPQGCYYIIAILDSGGRLSAKVIKD